MRKLFSLSMVLLVVAGLTLAACGGAATPVPTQAPAQPAAQPTQAPAQPAAQPTQAPAQPAAQPTQPPAATKTLKVGLVTDVGKIDDKSFNQSAWENIQRAQKDLGTEVKYIETTDPKDYAKNIATFGDENYDVIVTVGFGLGDATTEAAKQYPNVKFIGIDQDQTGKELPNVTGLNFPEDKSGFLAGALAALMSKTGKIGAICGTDAVPPVWRYGEGYKAGAASVNPKTTVSVVYHNDVGFDKTFTDPEWGKTTASSMIDKGADVIFGCGGKTGNGGLLAAADKGVYAIGVDKDQYDDLPEAQKALLTSAIKSITPFVFDLIKSVQDGAWKGGNALGGFGLAPYHNFDSKVPADVKAKIEEITKGLTDDSVKTGVSLVKPQ